MTRYRLWIPITLILLLTAFVVWRYAEEDTMRFGWAILAVIAGLFFTGIWWVFLAGKFRRKSLLLMVAGTALLFVAAGATLRYEGSADGATPLQFSWKWTPTVEQGINQLPVVGAVENGGTDVAEPTQDPEIVDSPSFLGPEADGTVENLDLDPSLQAEELWRQRIGIGWSAFAVAGEHAVTQEQRLDQELVSCYHLKTGELLWSHINYVRFEEPMGGPGPRATPTIADGVVYTVGGTGILNALTLDRGTVVWSSNTLEKFGLSNVMWGKANSPLIVDDKVVVTGGTIDPSKPTDNVPLLIAYSSDTGEVAWTSGSGAASYSSPRLIELAGVRQIVLISQNDVAGYNPETGEQLWSFPWEGPHPKVAQPIQTGPDQLLVTASYGYKSHLLKVSNEGGVWSVEPVWSERQMKTKFSSPVVLDGVAYGLDEGKMIAMDVATGERLWKGGRYGFGQNLLVGNAFILVQTERGDVVSVAPNKEELVELGRISPLSDKTWNAPTLAGKYLLVRNDREAVCLKLK